MKVESSVLQTSRVFWAASALLVASMSCAQTSSFPEMPVDAATVRVQNLAEEAYDQTDYRRAFFIYRNELVPIGDKYGQYMVGFMYLTGKGVEEDRIAASAWYRLAAERGTREFILARDQVMATLQDAQRNASDRLFVELRQQYGDLALLTRAVRKDYDELRGRTGSRLGSDSSPVAVVDMDATGVARSGSEYYGRIERRMKARLDYIARHAEIDVIDLDNMDIDNIERQVAARLSRVD